MAHTLYSDIIFDPELFMEYMAEMDPNPVAITASGILRPDPSLTAMLSGGGNFVTVPFFQPLTGSAQNYDGTADITVNKIESDSQSAMVIARANAWGSQDLAAELASKDPMMAIAEAVANYWRRERQRTLIQVLTGVFATANMSTHVSDVAIEEGTAATDANLISEDLIIDAIQAAVGDNFEKITAISVHSKVFARMKKLNLIDFTPLANQEIVVPRFLGKTVIVDDTHPVVAGSTDGFKYTSYLYGQSSIALSEAPVKTPVEIERQALLSGGREHLVNRQRYVLHPYGMDFLKSSVASNSPTDAELALAANWNRVYDTKNVALIKIVTNG